MWSNTYHEFDVFENTEFETNEEPSQVLKYGYEILEELKQASANQNIRYFIGKDKPGSTVFIKQIYLQADEYSEYCKETFFLKNLNHPNIIKVKDFFFDEKYGYIIEPFLAGGTFLDLVYANYPLDEDFLLGILHILLKTIEYLQCKNITHNDIKPDNIAFDTKNLGDLFESYEKLEKSLRLIDFASTKTREVGDDTFRTTFPPPEYRFNHLVSITYDIWSLGQMMYRIVIPECLIGFTRNDFYNESGFLEEPQWKDYPRLQMIVRDMLTFDYQHRPSANDLLKKYYDAG